MQIQEVDLRQVIGRLRPTSEFHWRGNGALGNDMSAIGEWRDPDTTPPTEAEILAEWEVVLAEEQVSASKRQVLAAARAANAPLDIDDFNGQSPLIQQLAQKIALLEQEIAELRGEG